MNQIFHPSVNTIAKASIIGTVLILAGLSIGLYYLVRSPYLAGVDVVVAQPVPFSHMNHVTDRGLDCRYCHPSVETASFAGMPNTKTCMTCHSQIWTEAPMLEPVRQSFQSGQPLEWNRVHNLADFVYFDHSIHINNGAACETCHGRVDKMPLAWKAETMLMEWCLECHRRPEKYIRPLDAVMTMGWPPPDYNQLAEGKKLVQTFGIEVGRLDDCSICHR